MALRDLYPGLIDATDLALIALLLLPWLPALVRRVEFPGGKIEFSEVRRAGEKVTKGLQQPPDYDGSMSSFLGSVDDDPNLALVALRIELERRLRQLASRHSIKENQSLRRVFGQLQERRVLADPVFSGLDELIAFGNQAAHGAQVDPRAVAWARDVGPHVLTVLDQHLDAGR